MDYLTSLFFSPAAPSKEAIGTFPPKAPAKKDLPLLISEKIKTPNVLENCCRAELKKLKRHLLNNPCEETNSTLEKVDTLIKEKKSLHAYAGKSLFSNKTGKAALQTFPKRIQNHSEDGTKFYGAGLSLKQMKAFIVEHGENLEEILICELDDELMELISVHCPKLTSFCYADGPGTWPELSEKGLAFLSKCVNLRTLHLNELMMVESKYLRILLETPCFIENIVNLRVPIIDCSDSSYPPIKKYQKIEELYLEGTAENIIEVLKETSFVNTLKKIRIDAYLISDAVIEVLGAYTNLEAVELIPYSGEVDYKGKKKVSWTVKPEIFQQFLQKHVHSLRKLTLGKEIEVDTESMKTILTLTNLKELAVNNCKGVGYLGFSSLGNMVNLTALVLGKLQSSYLEAFTDEQLAQLSTLKLESLSLDFKTSGYVTEAGFICLSQGQPLSKTLTSLTLCGINSSDIQGKQFGFLGNFENLKTLRIRDCYWFNDDSMGVLIGKKACKTIENLELKEEYVTPQFFPLLSRFPRLVNLGISRCPAMTKEAPEELANNWFIKNHLKGLAIDGINVNLNDMIKIVQFPHLEAFVTCNNRSRSFENAKDFNKKIRPGLIYRSSMGKDNVFDDLIYLQSLRG